MAEKGASLATVAELPRHKDRAPCNQQTQATENSAILKGQYDKKCVILTYGNAFEALEWKATRGYIKLSKTENVIFLRELSSKHYRYLFI